MSLFCDAIIALGIALGACEDAPMIDMPLPSEDKEVWDYHAPTDPEPVVTAPAPAPQPLWPPVVIKKFIAEHAPAPQPAEAAPPPEPEPNPYFLWAQATQSARYSLSRRQGHNRSQAIGISYTPTDTKLAALNGAVDQKSGTDGLKPKNNNKYKTEGRTSGAPVDNNRLVGEDRYITGILETGINSQLDSTDGGQVIIQTSRHVYGYHDREILIPKGSRLICDYKSPEEIGSTRISLSCKRILLAGHRAEITQIAATVDDVQARAGITGDVDNRFFEKYGTAFLLTGISAAVQMAAASFENTEGETNATSQILNSGSQEVSQKFGEVTASVLEQTVNLAPIVTVPQGTRIIIRPHHDWYISEFRKG